ncbi:hypothetical protein CRUP_010230 [Coryphaenoides rupestris]|nr:hypothetical protein CRUP_010230 [Coryphaenoides rupestris]
MKPRNLRGLLPVGMGPLVLEVSAALYGGSVRQWTVMLWLASVLNGPNLNVEPGNPKLSSKSWTTSKSLLSYQAQLTLGEKGPPGLAGELGSAGYIGQPGEAGLKGARGTRGLPGQLGVRGLEGQPGLPGYTLQVEDNKTPGPAGPLDTVIDLSLSRIPVIV